MNTSDVLSGDRGIPLGEPPEFVAFYKATVPRLVSMLRLLGASREDAAEAAQEAMIKVLPPNWYRIDACKRLAWCRTTATHEYYRLRRRSPEQLSDDPERLGASLLSPNDHYRATEEAAALGQLLEALPERRRQVLAWYLTGSTNAEIAEELGITESTVRTHIQLGLADLTGILKGGEERR